jgi:hypothetical protein
MLRPLLLCLLLLPAAPLAAWGDLGHRVVAELAERQLRPATRERALALLADDEAADLAAVAGWADRIRDLPQYDWARPLHYVNLPRSCRYDAERDCRHQACIVAAIERFGTELGDRGRAPASRAEALKFLVHFVADIHQPFHAGFAADLGGNRHQLSIDGRGSNLHAVWDRELPARHGDDAGAYADTLDRAGRPDPGSDQPAEWAEQSCALIDAHGLYPTGRKIGEEYLSRQLPLADARMRLAAARLARMIEQALGD